ncbi:hypothetical protein CcrColossus_gp296 [Caulobacter phage CcrColossus]|uniref:Uncharacterized protein n=1 Tax=Caulobacter phage CcrColossus TaxID=1211640 RepID=K4JSQ8_9CAUD|nr:hypothetical protein CcrColossus_gp296 [Caulobacter phage CcrColossus]AFU88166.1 hypothetical protein CcrColossus_gp296 [Caulobacter phage CcrColossus]
MLQTLIDHHKKQLAAAQSVLDTDGNLFSHEMRERARVDAARERDFIRTLETASAQLDRGDKYRHLKRGSTYNVLGQGIAQCETPIQDNDALVFYRDGQGRFFARHVDEFHDGRFEKVSAEPPREYVFVVGGQEAPCEQLSFDAFHALCMLGEIIFTDEQDYGSGLRGRYLMLGAEWSDQQRTRLILRRLNDTASAWSSGAEEA